MHDYTWLPPLRSTAREGAEQDDNRLWGWEAPPPPPPPVADRWEHLQQVVRHGEWLVAQYPQADEAVVCAACWLHDIRKYERDHAVRGAAFAADFLPTIGFPVEKIPVVVEAIAHHEGLFRPAEGWSDSTGEPFRAAPPLTPLETAILWDADKLSKIGPVSSLHYFGAMVGHANRKGETIGTLELQERNRHYSTVLVPRTIASLNTGAAQRRAPEQHNAYMVYHHALNQVLYREEEANISSV